MQDLKKFCKDLGVELYPKQLEILTNFYGNKNFRELLAILGRRSGKDTLGVVMALKEVDFLLNLKDPYAYYKLAPGRPIYILLVSCSSIQASIFFTELKCRINNSKYFKEKIDKVDEDRIHFKISGKKDRSIVIMSGHSNSEGLLGKRIFALILNEAASFKAADRIYSALGPATADFRNPSGKLDSKIITFTSPRYEGDIIHRLATEPVKRRLVARHSTWVVNPHLDEKCLRAEFRFMSDDEFMMEFGAEFLPAEGNQTVSLRLTGTMIDKLKRIARKEAYELDKDITYTDLVRNVLDEYLISEVEK